MKKFRFKSLLLFVFIISTFSSCYENCPAFPESLTHYFPYSTGQLIKFENEKNDTIFFSVDGCSTSKDYSRYIFSKEICIAEYTVLLVNNNYSSIQLTVLADDEGVLLNIQFMQAHGLDFFETKVNGVNPFLEKSNQIFGKTLTLTLDKSYHVSNVKIEINKGIVQFTDINTNSVWHLIE